MTAPAPVAPGEDLRRTLREKHGVRLVTEQEEGFGIHRLPNGVYGFTYATGLDEAPLFQQHRYQSFEVHKLSDGTVVLLGFVSPETARQIDDYQPVQFRLRPEPAAGAAVAVALPLWRIQRQKEHSARDGQGLEVHLIGGKM